MQDINLKRGNSITIYQADRLFKGGFIKTVSTHRTEYV